MKEEIKIPQMGESVSEATIGEILKATGTTVQEGDEIIELETEKVNQVLYAPCPGVITWDIKEGDTVKIGDVIGSVDRNNKPKEGSEKQEETPSKEIPTAPIAKSKKDAGVQMPSTEGRRITAKEFIQELAQPPEEKTPQQPEIFPTTQKKESTIKEKESRKRMTKIRKTIANRLVDALHSAAMLTTFNEADMSAIIDLRLKYKESFTQKHGVKLGLMSFFVKAVVEALKAFPGFNSYIEGDEIVTRHYYDIGIAVGTERGLIVPVVRNCDQLSFPAIEKEILNYAQKGRQGKISIKDLEGGGFTITNGGVYGSMLSTPILNPPQAGILGMHKIMKRPVAIDDKVEIRPMMYLALSYDHRIVDGKEAVSFLVRIKEILEDPSRLLFLEDDGTYLEIH